MVTRVSCEVTTAPYHKDTMSNDTNAQAEPLTMVPEPPKEIVIEQEDSRRLTEWITFFQKLSPRISLHSVGNIDLIEFLQHAERTLREEKHISRDYTIRDLPMPDHIAFVIQINSSEPCALFTTHVWRDTFFFTFGNIAFHLGHFEWDGEVNGSENSKSFSLGGYDRNLLTWEFIKNQIVRRVTELESRVPEKRQEA